MPLNVINVSSTGATTRLTAAAGSVNIIAQGVTLTSTSAGTVVAPSDANDISIIVEGAVYSANNAIFMGANDAAAAERSLTVTETGRVISEDLTGAFIRGDDSIFRNWGFVESHGSVGISMGDARPLFENYGTVSSTSLGFFSQAVLFESTDSMDGILRNFGTLTSSNQNNATVKTNASSGTTTIENHGTIASRGLAVVTSQANDELTNTGTISGDVQLVTGDDRVENSGLIDGTLNLGSGDDFYDGEGGSVTGDLLGAGGNDTMRGSMGADDLRGQAGRDVLIGRGGDDELRGGSAGDTLKGGGGDDELRGDSQPDDLYGGAGNDTLMGGDQNDRLWGGRDEDVLEGGNGADRMGGGLGDDILTGGSGADVFVFNTRAGFDTITDFQNGSDRIDISALGIRPQGFNNVILPALSDAGGGDTLFDLREIGGEGQVLIEGLGLGGADASDFIF